VTRDKVSFKTEILLNYKKNIFFYATERKVHHDYKNESVDTV